MSISVKRQMTDREALAILRLALSRAASLVDKYHLHAYPNSTTKPYLEELFASDPEIRAAYELAKRVKE